MKHKSTFLQLIFAALIIHPAGVFAGEDIVKSESRNIILVVLNGLRTDQLGCYGNAKSTTPVIDALAAEGILFQQAFSRRGAAAAEGTALPIEGNLLMRLLGKKGYRTERFSGQSGMESASTWLTKREKKDKQFFLFVVDEDDSGTSGGGAAAADRSLGNLRLVLERQSLLDDSLVIVTAERGAEPGEDAVRVPLIVRFHGVTPRRVSGVVSLVDVAPTLLDWAGISPTEPLHGTSFRSLLETGDQNGMKSSRPAESLRRQLIDVGYW